MKKQELRSLIREEIKKTLKESNTEFDKLSDKLISMATAGTISNDDIKDLNQKLITARRKMFAAKQSTNRSAATEKGKATKAWNKLIDQANDETDKALNITDEADSFALSTNMHKDKALQARYNKKYNEILTKLGSNAGLGPVPDELKGENR